MSHAEEGGREDAGIATIPRLRLASHRLVGRGFGDPVEVVRHAGAVQAQDHPAALWSVGLRLRDATHDVVERALDEGRIVRTHAMRPTWHLLTAEDARWILALTSPRVHAANARMYRTLELDDRTLGRAHEIIAAALEDGRHLTRPELGQELERRGIPATGQRLAYFMMHAELEALVCNGPRRGKQQTYALFDERVPPSRTVDRDEAVARLAARFFTSHGPARVADFAKWSGLAPADARAGLASAEPELASRTIDGDTYWLAPGLRPAPATSTPRTWLLSVYDEYLIGYDDRSDICPPEIAEQLFRMGNALTSVLVVDGLAAGTWKRTLSARSVRVDVAPLRRLTAAQRGSVAAAGERLGRFLDLPVELHQ